MKNILFLISIIFVVNSTFSQNKKNTTAAKKPISKTKTPPPITVKPDLFSLKNSIITDSIIFENLVFADNLKKSVELIYNKYYQSEEEYIAYNNFLELKRYYDFTKPLEKQIKDIAEINCTKDSIINKKKYFSTNNIVGDSEIGLVYMIIENSISNYTGGIDNIKYLNSLTKQQKNKIIKNYNTEVLPSITKMKLLIEKTDNIFMMHPELTKQKDLF